MSHDHIKQLRSTKRQLLVFLGITLWSLILLLWFQQGILFPGDRVVSLGLDLERVTTSLLKLTGFCYRDGEVQSWLCGCCSKNQASCTCTYLMPPSMSWLHSWSSSVVFLSKYLFSMKELDMKSCKTFSLVYEGPQEGFVTLKSRAVSTTSLPIIPIQGTAEWFGLEAP